MSDKDSRNPQSFEENTGAFKSTEKIFENNKGISGVSDKNKNEKTKQKQTTSRMKPASSKHIQKDKEKIQTDVIVQPKVLKNGINTVEKTVQESKPQKIIDSNEKCKNEKKGQTQKMFFQSNKKEILNREASLDNVSMIEFNFQQPIEIDTNVFDANKIKYKRLDASNTSRSISPTPLVVGNLSSHESINDVGSNDVYSSDQAFYPTFTNESKKKKVASSAKTVEAIMGPKQASTGRKMFLPQEPEKMFVHSGFFSSEKERKFSDQPFSCRQSIDSQEGIEVIWKTSERIINDEDYTKNFGKESLSVPLNRSDSLRHIGGKDSLVFTTTEVNKQHHPPMLHTALQAAFPNKSDYPIEKQTLVKRADSKATFEMHPSSNISKQFVPYKELYSKWGKKLIYSGGLEKEDYPRQHDSITSWFRRSSALSRKESIPSSSRTTLLSNMSDVFSGLNLHQTDSIRTEAASIGTTAEHVNARISRNRFFLLKRFATFVAEDQFINDEDHKTFIKTVKQRATVETPEPVIATLKLEIFPILLDTLKHYRIDLGRNHRLTVEMEGTIKKMKREISNFNVKDVQ